MSSCAETQIREARETLERANLIARPDERERGNFVASGTGSAGLGNLAGIAKP